MLFNNLNFLKVRKIKTIHDLDKRKIDTFKIDEKLRAKTSILIIDDEGYDVEHIKELGYVNIHKKYEHTNMKDYAPYDIILCDINNVAKHIDNKYQGAALAKLIKDQYPEKIIVIYSSKSQTVDLNQFYKEVDDVISKDLSARELYEKLEKYIKVINNPIHYWKNTRRNLLYKDISPINIAVLEHLYVKSILDNKVYEKQFLQVRDRNNLEVLNKIILILLELLKEYLKGR